MTVLVFSARTLVVLAVVAAGIRLLGKREASQLTIYDLAMLMALSNAVQNAMTAGRGDLQIGLASAATLVLATWLVARLGLRRPAVERRLAGAPVLLVYDGRALAHRLRRENVSRDQLLAALRERGIASPKRVKMAVLEVDGSITVVPRSTDVS